jgi:outer membrane protein OmpA-like peptidoglycan-associated protein
MKRVNLKKDILFLYGIFVIAAILSVSCSSTKQTVIKPVNFPAVSEIQLGESAVLTWHFEGADKVRIENLRRNYDPVDSITVKPDANTIYDFLAIKGQDTVLFKWHVFVKTPEDKITTGIPAPSETTPSFLTSDYFSGTIDFSSSVKPANFRILSHEFSKDILKLNLLVFDEFGNFIKGLDKNPRFSADLSARLVNHPSQATSNPRIESFKKVKNDNRFLDIAVLLDNSAIAGDFYPIFENLKNFFKGLDNEHRVMFRSFNQKINTSYSLQNADKFYNFIRNVGLEKASGFSAVYKSSLATLQTLSSMASGNKPILILIAYSTDNSSLVYDRNDLVDLAVSRGIPIYIIGVGNAVDTYSLKYVSDYTGGRYYGIEDSNLFDLTKVLNEIVFANSTSCELSLVMPGTVPPDTKYSNLILSHTTATPRILDTLKIPKVKEQQFFRYQAVASFEQRDTVLSRDFDETISTLARVLVENPDKTVELIGNSSIEGNEEQSRQIALRRAQEVRRKLIDLGANPASVRVRSDGSSNPIYYLQNSFWAQYYNRRVELRWLLPELLPFEIITGIKDSESDALRQVEEWENIGYRSYYDRILQNNNAVYRVKIWGFKTQKDAEDTAKRLSQRFAGMQFEIR